MDICQHTEEQLPELVLGLLSEEEGRRVEAHLATCARCSAALEAFTTLERRGLGEETVPASLREQTLSQVHAALAQKSQPAERLSSGRLALAIGGGMGSVLVFLGILWERAGLEGLPAAQLVLASTLWMGLMVAAACWALGDYRLRRWNPGPGALFALSTSVLAIMGILLCPQETYFALWERSAMSRIVIEALGMGSSYALFGMIYGLPTALLVAGGLGNRLRQESGLLAAAMAVALWLPAVYLQCSALAFGLFVAWAAGALGGVLGGFWGGVGIHRLVPALRS